ncbi:MAG: hypothetical protein N2999_04100 [Proteobacteria bacterium]|nr:hypothetical protein [Pseudomonadota bacterium]
MKIKVIKEKCTACGLCENICSLTHTGTVNKKRSAIRIFMDDLGDSIHTPLLCLQCKKMKCLEAENLSETEITEEKKKFLWENLLRASNCPFNGCFAHEGKVYHCNLCDGDPQCVKVCTNSALILID